MSPRICLDFGTAFSKASAFVPGGASPRECVRPLAIGADGDHRFLTPSVLFIEQGRIVVGAPALARASAGVNAGRDPILSFKTVLAASDLEAALALKVRPSIDPTGTLRHRDAFVLYLAHLDQLIRRAIAAEPALPGGLADAARRYTTPIWRRRREGDAALARLFDEAVIVSDWLGQGLASADGVSISQAKVALEKGEAALGIGQLERGVFEAHAAAAAYAAFARDPQSLVLVVDMGGGTTDIAGFENDPAHQTMTEIVGARQSCGLAGDEVDQILLNMLAAKASARTPSDQSAAWRILKLAARPLKEELFSSGRCTIQVGRKKVELRRDALLAHPDMRDLARALSDVIAASVRAVASAGGANQKLTVLLAGGGANLSFMSEAVRAASAKAGERDVAVERFGANWHLPSGFDATIERAFPQLAISLGGALADMNETHSAPLAHA